jgi:putative oxidoreductase
MKIATVVARILLGLVFVIFGLNIFLHFLPMPLPEERQGIFLKPYS